MTHQTLNDLLTASAAAHGDAVFAVSDDGTDSITFADLARRAAAFGSGLRDRFGIAPGDPVALLMPNCVEFLPAYFGILHAGAAAVPVNIRLKPAELEFIFNNSGARAIIVHPKTWRAAKEATAGTTIPLLGVGFAAGEDLTAGDELPAGVVSLESLAADCPGPASPRSRHDTAAIIYTSGTTGRPKGAMLSHSNILFNIEATRAGHGLRGADNHLLVVPLFHVTGLNTLMPTALDQGAKLVISSQVDPVQLINVIRRQQCTTFFGVPTTFYLLTNLKDTPVVPSLRLICYSGAPMAPLTIRKLRTMFPGVELHNFFGLTETTSVTTVLPDDQALARVESVGLPPPGIELAIFNESGELQEPGGVGELAVKGPGVFKGYLGRSVHETTAGGWFLTGDAALLDSDGYLFLRGRIKEMIIVAGENVYPIEVENALCSHPAVQEAAVFGRQDALFGEIVHAAVVLRPDETTTEQDLKRHLNDRLASFKTPRTIRFLPSLPRNPSGKVVKRELL